MAGNEPENDAAFVDALMSHLPTTAVPSSLEARILADFDRIAERNKPGAMKRWMLRWRDRVWPGAPVWQPASLLALSLAIGLAVGAFVPTSSLSAAPTSTANTDQVLSATDTTSALDLYKDL